MARANIRTWLPLDQWARYFGVNPLHFNQAFSAFYSAENCGDVWFQYAWQRSNQVGRYELAEAIHTAEKVIADQVHYNLVPDWTAAERRILTRPARRDVFRAANLNIRGQASSVELKLGHFIQAGVQVKQTLVAGAPVVYSDVDGDAFNERATVVVASGAALECDVRVYFAGEGGNDEFEIRPIKVSIAGGLATITFDSWMAFDPDLHEAAQADPIDGDDPASYVASVDVFRVYNDRSTEGLLVWEPVGGSMCGCGSPTCNACTVGSQTACLAIRDAEMGLVTYNPALYAAGAWTETALAECRDADRLYASYLSGWQDERAVCPLKDMDPWWVGAVARYSAALLDREVCSCNNTENFIKEQRRDIAAVRTGIIFQVSNDSMIGNPFGTWVGAIYAWNRATANGRSLPK